MFVKRVYCIFFLMFAGTALMKSRSSLWLPGTNAVCCCTKETEEGACLVWSRVSNTVTAAGGPDNATMGR